ncbi:Gfo/Idh/MocA family protein [Fulvivirga lutea]|uniref:Gfo/Idh/MocA family oxidoreductase n=1 Tax=Fulvivirga lutea TaxID=2810512 RepID=A0A974WIK7_9BACT|nr:Gfo/Idh/MocA family oxidoreductase [Fulvivirga lutea]QSE96815.1 Gfo/Idh/MocA family oxidoreductase [Fulvivirga lutea]
MKVLIIGLGSIASKHIAALRTVNAECSIWALRSKTNAKSNTGIINIYDWKDIPDDLDFIIVSNVTSQHLETITQCLKYKVPLFVEKPPFNTLDGTDAVLKKIKEVGIRTYTAFNFRFNPLIKWLKENLEGKRIIEIQTYCGSYLPDWRPSRDYRRVYSANKDLGGGVHLDLIHELDYTFWLFGTPNKVESKRRKISDLEINSIDSAQYWLEYDRMNITISLNYFRRDPKRQMEIVFDDTTWIVDLLHGKITDSNGLLIFEDLKKENTYENQMKYFISQLHSGNAFMNDLEESSCLLKYCLTE